METNKRPPSLDPIPYNRDANDRELLTPGLRYVVCYKDNRTKTEIYNGTGFAYNDKVITWYFLPSIDSF